MNKMPIVIPCGGLGTRMGSITRNLQKIMIPINDQPFLYYLLKSLRQIGRSEVHLLIEHFSEQVVSFFEENQINGMNIKYVNSKNYERTHTLAMRGKVGTPFIQIAGNILFDTALINKLESKALDNPCTPIIVSTCTHRASGHLSVIADENGLVKDTIRGYPRENGDLEMMDIYVLTDRVMELMDEHKISYCRALEAMIQKGEKIIHLLYEDEWFHLETLDDINNDNLVEYTRMIIKK